MENKFRNLPLATKNVVRNIEKLVTKKNNAKNAIAFNQTCLNNNILPKYTRRLRLFFTK